MKTKFYTRIFSIALVMAVVAAAAHVSLAQSQSSLPAADGTLPPNVQPGSPLAEVIKLVQAGVEAGTIRSYIANTPGAFGLDAGIIVYLTDVGTPTDIVNTMMEHDKNISAPVAASAPPVPAPAAAPTTEMTVNQLDQSLSPYGSWVELEGYGRCWRPTTVIYDSTWQPYCDRGHWVYSDYGWYWDSDYSWGVTFHYGRWFHHSRFGWCWWPDTVWAPSWVMWRSHNDYCGWAPLPPFAVYRPGTGFFYRGTRVAVGFDFGLGAESFTFVSANRFSERHPRYYRAEPDRVRQIFNQTTIINNYNVHNRTIVNGGIPVERINAVARRPLQPVSISQIPHAERQGWRETGTALPTDSHGRNVSPGNSQSHNIPVLRTDQNNNNVHQPVSTPAGVNPVRQQPENNKRLSTPDRSVNETKPVRPPASVPTDIHAGNREVPSHNVSPPPDTHQNVVPSAGNNVHPPVSTPAGVNPVWQQPENNKRLSIPDRSINETKPVRPSASVPTDIHAGNREVPSHNVSPPPDTHQNVVPSAGNNVHQSQTEAKSVRPVENNPRSQTPSVFSSPRSATPSAPPPSSSPSHNSDRDK